MKTNYRSHTDQRLPLVVMEGGGNSFQGTERKKKKRKAPYDRKRDRSNRRGGESKKPWRRHEVITTGRKKNREIDERNEREQKVKALALDLPVDPLQMRTLPIISHTPSAGSRNSFTRTCMHRACTKTHNSWQQNREGGLFFSPKWREGEKEGEVEGRL